MKLASPSNLEALLNALAQTTHEWSSESSESEDCSSGKLQQFVSDFWMARTLYVAVELGIADLLGAGVHRIDELAIATGTDAPSLYQLLHVLVSAGVFAEETNAAFTLTPVSQKLRGDIPDSLRPLILAKLGRPQAHASGNIFRRVRRGRVSQKDTFSSHSPQAYSHFSKNASFVDQGLGSVAAHIQAAVLQAYDFSFARTIIDVGGGDGNFLAFLLQSDKALHGILMEQPGVIENARRRLAAEGVSERCKVIAGDFFEFLPTGGDIYVLKGILSDYEEARALQILANCRRAMPPSSKLLLIDTMGPTGAPSFFLNFHEGSRLALACGQERTAEKFCALLRQAGFRVSDVLPIYAETNLIVAV